MKKNLSNYVLALFSLVPLSVTAQKMPGTVELLPLGDFEQWATQDVKESSILGGQVKRLYYIAPEAELDGEVFPNDLASIWGTSNTYARIMGIIKTSSSVEPDKGPTGLCAKLKTGFISCKAAGMFTINAIAQGSVYLGRCVRPVAGTKEPYSYMDWGIPFTERPVALIMDYKAELNKTGMLTKASSSKVTVTKGSDPEEIIFILQKRWEDSKGNIHALRVGTAGTHITQDTQGWVTDARFDVLYGNAGSRLEPFLDLGTGVHKFHAVNSNGKAVPVVEEGWADADEQPTHAIIMITTGSQGFCLGALDNTLWIDNLRLAY